MVKTVPSIVATEGPYTTSIPPTVVVIGAAVIGVGFGLEIGAATAPAPEGGRVIVTPAPTTLDGSIVNVSVPTITVEVCWVGLSINV